MVATFLVEFKLKSEEITGLKHVGLIVVGLAAYEYGEGQEEGGGGGGGVGGVG